LSPPAAIRDLDDAVPVAARDRGNSAERRGPDSRVPHRGRRIRHAALHGPRLGRSSARSALHGAHGKRGLAPDRSSRTWDDPANGWNGIRWLTNGPTIACSRRARLTQTFG